MFAILAQPSGGTAGGAAAGGPLERLAPGLASVCALLGLLLAAAADRRIVRCLGELQHGRRTLGLLQAAVASIGDGVLVRDAADRVQAWNPRLLELFPWLAGVVAEGGAYRCLVDAAAGHRLPQAGTAEREAWVAQCVQRGLGTQWGRELLLEGGRVVQVIERLLPDGGVVSSFRDITGAERLPHPAQQATEGADAARTRFLATLSHEMRTRLHGLLGANRQLASSALDERQRQRCAAIESAGMTLLSGVDELLDLARIEAGAMPLDGSAVTLHSRVGDARWLRQILFNLLGDACRFTEAGSTSATAADTVQFEAGSERWQLVLTVRDTGSGVDAVLHKPFDLAQLQTTLEQALAERPLERTPAAGS